MTRLGLVTLVVDDQDAAIAFFVDAVGFVLEADEPSTSSTGAPKRWVVVRPPGGGTGLLLALASDDAQRAAVGAQTGGRVGFFLEVDDFATAHARMLAHGVVFREEPRHEVYGTVAVFTDVAGNDWDMIQPSA